MAIAWGAAASAGAFPKEVGRAYAKAQADVYRTVRYVAPGTEPGGSYVGQQYGVYAEAGVVPGWRATVALALPLVVGTHHATYADPFGSTEVRASTIRTGDLVLAAGVALHPDAAVALVLDAKLPTYANGRVGEGWPLYRPLFPKPGDGQIDLGAMLFAGIPWDGGFAEAGLGFLHRTEAFVGWDTDLAFADGVRGSAKAGHALGRVLPLLAVDAVVTPRPTPVTRSAVTVSVSARVDLVAGWALEPRAAAEVWVRNASQGLGGGLGLSWRR